MLNPKEGETDIPFAEFLIKEIGMTDIGFIDFYRTYRLVDKGTNLLLGFDKRQYRISDGRILVNVAYWRGHLESGIDAAQMLAKYAGNLERELTK